MAEFERQGVGGLTVEQRQTFDRRLLTRLRPVWNYNKFGLKRSIPAGGSNSIQVRRMQVIAGSTTALTEGTPGASIRATWVSVAATVSQYGQYIMFSEISTKQAFDQILPETIDNLGEAMADSLDLLTRNQIRGGTNIQYASTAGSRGEVGSGMLLSSAEIREAVATMKTNNVKPVEDGFFVAFIHPNTWRDFMGDSNVVNALQYAAARGSENNLFTGKIPDYLGVRFYESSNASVQSSLGFSGADVYQTIIIGMESYMVVDYEAIPP